MRLLDRLHFCPTEFNHPLLVTASALALLLACSGFWMLFYRVRLRR